MPNQQTHTGDTSRRGFASMDESKQREIAAALGCTRLWVIQMEDGKAPVERLREYWGF